MHKGEWGVKRNRVAAGQAPTPQKHTGVVNRAGLVQSNHTTLGLLRVANQTTVDTPFPHATAYGDGGQSEAGCSGVDSQVERLLAVDAAPVALRLVIAACKHRLRARASFRSQDE